MELSPVWEFVSDKVMGGVSKGTLIAEELEDIKVTRLTGQVSLENNGGFLQMAFNLTPIRQLFDASAWSGIEIDVIGNLQTYDLRLRTNELTRPWQSYRSSFIAPKNLTSIQISFHDFKAHRTEIPLNTRRLRRIGVLAIGRVFAADIAVAGIRLFRQSPQASRSS